MLPAPMVIRPTDLRGSARWPAEIATAQDVGMHVEHRLAGLFASVEHQAERLKPLVRGHRRGLADDLGERLGIGLGERRGVTVVILRHDQHVRGCLGGDVAESQDPGGLTYHRGRDLAPDDLAEQAVGIVHATHRRRNGRDMEVAAEPAEVGPGPRPIDVRSAMTDLADDVLGSGGEQPDDVRRPEQRRRRRRNRRILLVVLTTLLVLVLTVAGGAWWFVNRISSNIERIPGAFDIPESQRPEQLAGSDSITFLLGGLDGAEQVDVYEPGAARTDTIMLVHIPEQHNRAYLVSIPRDTYIDIPGHGQNKINAAYSFGGPALFVQTVEQLTGIRINHLALIDWTGFEALTDALGGVPMHFDEPVPLADGRSSLPAGDHVLSGDEALQYVRERKQLPGGDFDRVKRQQNYLRGLMTEMLSTGTLTSPGTIADVAGAIGEAARVDEQLTATGMVDLGLSMRNLRAQNVTFLTVPTAGTGWAGPQSIVVYDEPRAQQLWKALIEDDMDSFLAANPDLVTGETVN